MYTLVEEFRYSWVISTVALTRILCNTLFSRNQNMHKSGNRFIPKFYDSNLNAPSERIWFNCESVAAAEAPNCQRRVKTKVKNGEGGKTTIFASPSFIFINKSHAWPLLVIGECQCHDIRRQQCGGDGAAQHTVLYWRLGGSFKLLNRLSSTYEYKPHTWPQSMI